MRILHRNLILQPRAWLVCLLFGFALGSAGLTHAKSLSWPSLVVQLRIDEEGSMHVTERHTMLFDGDWNGGERRFQVRAWQDIELVSVSQITRDDGARISLQEGDLDAVNEYRLTDNTLRWRSRLPTDPAFSNEIRTYEIVYTIEGGLLADEQTNVYLLNHDLAFPDRPGPIDQFEAIIELAPVWQASELPRVIRHDHLAPGQSVFVNDSIQYLGMGEPSAIGRPPEAPSATSRPSLRYLMVAIVLSFALLLFLDWLRSERTRRRFDPLISPDEIDETWLTANVFKMKPELVGAAWDRDTSAAEVSALIARLVQESKISSSVSKRGWGPFKRDTLHMKLLQSREKFAAYERRLIDALFFDSAESTDTDAIRAHYKKRGFNPAGLIESPIARKLPAIFKNRYSVAAWRKWMTSALLLSGAGLAVLGSMRAGDETFPLIVIVLPWAALFLAGVILAYSYSDHVHGLRGRAFRALLPAILIVVGVSWLQLGGVVPLTLLQSIGLVLLALSSLNSIFNRMHGTDNSSGLQLRRTLASARHYFQRELDSAEPRLKDEWLPYLLAFDLGPHIKRWFKAFEGHTRTHTSFGTSGGGSSIGSSSSTASSSWSGGGGLFGGAGASASWTSAVAGVAAGVSMPSSSGSSGGSGGGGGGGGGGSSSGGGGGGGW